MGMVGLRLGTLVSVVLLESQKERQKDNLFIVIYILFYFFFGGVLGAGGGEVPQQKTRLCRHARFWAPATKNSS